MGRQDVETETLIVHALFVDGFDASEDGTSRGTPMVPIAICTAHTQSNGHGFSDVIAHKLEQTNSQAVAFNLRGREGGAMPEPSPMACELINTARMRSNKTKFPKKMKPKSVASQQLNQQMKLLV